MTNQEDNVPGRVMQVVSMPLIPSANDEHLDALYVILCHAAPFTESTARGFLDMVEVCRRGYIALRRVALPRTTLPR